MIRKCVSARAGVTLIELIVVLAIIGITFAIARIAMRETGKRPRTLDVRASAREQLALARREALQSGKRVVVTVHDNDASYAATAWPDGRVVAESTLAKFTGIDPLSGRVSSATANAVDFR